MTVMAPHAPQQLPEPIPQQQQQPQLRGSTGSRARGLRPRLLLAAFGAAALVGMAVGLPSAAAVLPGGGPAPRRGRPTAGRGGAIGGSGSSGGFVPPPPPPAPQEEQPQLQQQPATGGHQQAGAAYQVQTRPWGPASGSYTYQRYYTSQAAGQAGADGRGGGNEVLYPRIMRTVGNTGVCVLFMILTARATHLYELADQVSGALKRYLVTIPVVGLLCANLVGVLLSLVQSFSRNSRLKTRLKAILTLNGLAEVVMVAYNSVRLVLGNDKWTPREAYVGRIFTSIWILTICFAFSTSRWDNNAFGGQP